MPFSDRAPDPADQIRRRLADGKYAQREVAEDQSHPVQRQLAHPTLPRKPIEVQGHASVRVRRIFAVNKDTAPRVAQTRRGEDLAIQVLGNSEQVLESGVFGIDPQVRLGWRMHGPISFVDVEVQTPTAGSQGRPSLTPRVGHRRAWCVAPVGRRRPGFNRGVSCTSHDWPLQGGHTHSKCTYVRTPSI